MVAGRATAHLGSSCLIAKIRTQEVRHMSRRIYCGVTGIIFVVNALVTLLSIVNAWKVVIGPSTVPEWMSWVVLVVAGYLGYTGIRFARSWLP